MSRRYGETPRTEEDELFNLTVKQNVNGQLVPRERLLNLTTTQIPQISQAEPSASTACCSNHRSCYALQIPRGCLLP